MACPRCGKADARLPNTQTGVNIEQFNKIYNWFDVYVQYSVCEGFGMPQIEAAACGIPLITVDYSAMQSVGRNISADLVRVESYSRDGATLAWRANPDDNDLEQKITDFLRLSKEEREKKANVTYLAAKELYNWDRTASVWEKNLDSIIPKPIDQTWDAPPRIAEPNMNPPANLTNEEFVRWVIMHTWREGNKMNSYVSLRLLRDLNYGRIIGSAQHIHYNEESVLGSKGDFAPFTRQDLLNYMKSLCEGRNYWERRRVGLEPANKPVFIEMAKPSDEEIEAIAKELVEA
jgi:hypothetical protein